MNIKKILAQKEKLVSKHPNLENYFIPIYLQEWNCTIPFLPIRCFRDFDLHAEYSSLKNDHYKIFLSSGSTGNNPAHHIFSKESLKSYEKNTCNGFENFLKKHKFSKGTPIISLVPKTSQWPKSSLAFMIESFLKNQFQIIYCDVEANPHNIFHAFSSFAEGSDVIIFGTTFHHMLLIYSLSALVNKNNNSQQQNLLQVFDKLQNLFQKYSFSIIDTGGTKGRTQAFTLDETIHFFKKFYCGKNFRFFSEYGMCELSSQAWSAQENIHDGSFFCNKTLTPFSIDLDDGKSLEHFEDGFLGVVDFGNEESYQAIITEDICYKYKDNEFKLLGRSPDASLKGCSLNVRSFFQFESHSNPFKIKNQESIRKQQSFGDTRSFIGQIHDFDSLLSHLNPEFWTEKSTRDLEKSLNSLRILNFVSLSCEDSNLNISSLQKKSLLIIASSNTPIAWVYPFVLAGFNGAKSVILKLPSLRLEDSFSRTVRNQIQDLLILFSNLFPKMDVYLDEGKSLSQIFNEFDFVLTFGSDETIKTISSQVNNKETKFIGLGDVKNSYFLEIFSMKVMVDILSIWNGRGCLTPCSLFIREQEISQNDIQNFAEIFEKEMSERYQLSPQKYFHCHSSAFVKSQLRQAKLNPDRVIKKNHTCVVNLMDVEVDILKTLNLDFQLSGCGFVYLFSENTMNLYNSYFTFYELFPKINSTHMGKAWKEIFRKIGPYI